MSDWLAVIIEEKTSFNNIHTFEHKKCNKIFKKIPEISTECRSCLFEWNCICEFLYCSWQLLVVLCNIRTLSNMNYIIIAIETHMCTYSICIYAKTHVTCTSVRVSTCAREGSLKTLKWVQLLPGKGAKFFGSAIFQFIILAEGSWNKLNWFFCTCS